ncbi:class I SAM-dependent methyltransferase [Limnobacter parvus]|uniref:Class I SAM-dependent methyltransferase n=1 Tax=Limnobacter parvus TaxID=2939690 RepID=A0ABT1XE86_9BURK|nr:class I SAM-dependent methyltransferase [Limnobacter parvus]MCR2745209.1 class I SAM-dependent methyltransferase [Limnobacter parvus]
MSYEWLNGEHCDSHGYLLPALLREADLIGVVGRAFDLGCGNGSIARAMQAKGWKVSGVDPSLDGVMFAKDNDPYIDLHVGSAYDDLRTKFGTFHLVYSLEVVEHLYAPRDYAKTLVSLMQDDGVAIVSTPYHGYWKNLVMALTGRMDSHFTALWDDGHIKFWSIRTLTQLFAEVGLDVIRINRIGRVPALAKSMILVLKKKNNT